MALQKLVKEIFKVAVQEVELLGIKRGHRNTGAGFDSFRMGMETDAIVCYMLDYMVIVDEGFDKTKASFQQFPFLVEYFESKGFQGNEAKGIAAATINKWIKEGMSTKASRRYSKDGKRNDYIVDGLENARQPIRLLIIKYVNSKFKEGTQFLRA